MKIICKLFFTTMLLLFTNILFGQKAIVKSIDKVGEKYTKKKKNHGLVIGILNGEESMVRSFGQISKENTAKPDGKTMFEIGTVSSVFTTTVMQVLADRKVFNSGQPVKYQIQNERRIPVYRPEKCIANYDYTTSCVTDYTARTECFTFCDLAGHVSGIPKSFERGYFWDPITDKNFEGKYNRISSTDFSKKIEAVKLKSPGGKKYKYSVIGIALLGDVMREKVELSFEDILEKEIFKPLKMKETKIGFSKNKKSKLIQGHNEKGKPVSAWEIDALAPAIGLHSNANDLLIFLNENLSTTNKALENAFSEVHQNKIEIFSKKNNRPTWMGFGWFTSTLSENTNQPVIWINGGTNGMRAFIGFVKDSKTAVVVLSNSANSVDELGFEILEILNQN